MKKIWCLFSIENNYDQPNNNLIGWWADKPDFEIISKAIGIPFTGEKNILSIVGIHQLEKRRIGNTDFRLEEIKEGTL